MGLFSKKIKSGSAYACQAGDHAGKMLIYISKKGEKYGFLSIPTMENLWIPTKEFDNGIKNSIIEYVERVPKEVRKVTEAQFLSNSLIDEKKI
jgi:hypothetical protein